MPQLNDAVMHHKRHWDFKSLMMSQAHKLVKSLHTALSCIGTKIILELLKAFLYPAVLQIFVHDSSET